MQTFNSVMVIYFQLKNLGEYGGYGKSFGQYVSREDYHALTMLLSLFDGQLRRSLADVYEIDYAE